jgi:hypothetical protein
MSLVAIDPGYAARGKGCACAWFDSAGSLGAVWFARSGEGCERPVAHVSRVVWERPEARVRGGGANAATLIALTDAGATLAGQYAGVYGAHVMSVTPHAWKGNLPKPVQHSHLWEVLTERETEVLGGHATWCAIDAARKKGAAKRWPPGRTFYPRGWDTHNLLDAAALGCVVLGRLDTRKENAT